jgi:predicted  nucleic acid-binding Zn-ribbon protein
VSGFSISTGELIDRLSIANIKVWRSEEAMSAAKTDKEIARYALMIRAMNKERSEIREEINQRLDGRQRGTIKIEYGKNKREIGS